MGEKEKRKIRLSGHCCVDVTSTGSECCITTPPSVLGVRGKTTKQMVCKGQTSTNWLSRSKNGETQQHLGGGALDAREGGVGALIFSFLANPRKCCAVGKSAELTVACILDARASASLLNFSRPNDPLDNDLNKETAALRVRHRARGKEKKKFHEWEQKEPLIDLPKAGGGPG